MCHLSLPCPPLPPPPPQNHTNRNKELGRENDAVIVQRRRVEHDLEKLQGRMNQDEAHQAAKKSAEQDAEELKEVSKTLADFTRSVNKAVNNMSSMGMGRAHGQPSSSDAAAALAAEDEKVWRGSCIMLERFLVGKTTSGGGVCTCTFRVARALPSLIHSRAPALSRQARAQPPTIRTSSTTCPSPFITHYSTTYLPTHLPT